MTELQPLTSKVFDDDEDDDDDEEAHRVGVDMRRLSVLYSLEKRSLSVTLNVSYSL